MDLKNNVNAALLVYEGLVKGKTDFAKLPFYPQKLRLMETDKENRFVKTSPERTGLDSRRITAMLERLSASHDAALHSIFMLSDGKEVLSASAPGYSVTMPHATFSMCKTVTGLAIGMLVDDGLLSLSDKVYTFFPEEKPLLLSARTRAITVEHLLSMRSGVSFNEAGAVVESKWINSFLSSAVRFTPGKKFAYNSMNSYMLAAIVTRVTGRSLSAFLEERLFAPLGIKNAFWEKSPEGIEKGGWGLYLSAISMAKLGQLFLDGGTYNGERIISEAWLNEMTKRHVSVSDAIGKYDYGYHLWVHKTNESYLFNGMLGQNVRVDPRTRTVIAITAGDTCLFQTAHSLLAAEWALESAEKGKPRPASPFARLRLRRAERDFGKEGAWLPYKRSREEKRLAAALRAHSLFSEHSVSTNNAGLLPMLVRLVQNNHTGGLRDVTLRERDGDILLTFSERDECYTVCAGHNKLIHSSLSVHGELYRIACGYAFARDEGRAPILKIQIIFPELCSERRLVFRVMDGHLTLSLSEAPDFTFVEKLMTSAHLATGQGGGFMEFLQEKLNLDALLLRASTVFAPVLRLKSLSTPIDSVETDDPLGVKAPIPNTVLPSLIDAEEAKGERDAAEAKLLHAQKRSKKKGHTFSLKEKLQKKP